MRYDTFDLAAPVARAAFVALDKSLRRSTPFLPFETYRSPEQQDLAFRRGVSKAVAFQSPHQFGLAVDFVPFIDGRWTWPDGDQPIWAELDRMAKSHGLLRPISWDRPHIEHPAWAAVRKLVLV